MLVLAHRGAHEPETEGVRENTIAAFQAAADLGVDGVELDVHRLADGSLPVLHDPPTPPLPSWVPTLEAALAVRQRSMVNIELKNSPLDPTFDPDHRVAGDVAGLLRGRPGALVSSFNLATLDAFHAADPATPTGWLTLGRYDQDEALATVVANGHRAINPPEAVVTSALVKAAHDAGVQVITWTVNAADRMLELADWDVDVLVTDRPRLALTVLR